MSRPTGHSERVLPAHAAVLRRGAAKREAEAVRMRAEAEELERRWAEHCAQREAEKASA